MPLSRDPTDAFARFLAAFPERDGGHDADAAREAWGRAIGRADPVTIIAGAARSREGQLARYTMSARRWLDEGRWRVAAPISGASSPSALVWIAYGSPAWDAWAAFYKLTRGKTPPMDRRGGWRFAGPEPPRLPDAVE
jgi:hypothetical protein